MAHDLKSGRVGYSPKGLGSEGRSEGGAGNARKGPSVGSAGGVGLQTPMAAREPVEHVIHGDRRVDHYGWLKNRKDPRVKEYLEAENAYLEAMMRSTEGFQEKLYREMLGRIQQTDLSVPYRLRGYWYYTRTEEGKQYSIYCRKTDGGRGAQSATPEQEEEVLLDLNEMAAGHAFMGLGIFEVSEDNLLLAYATDTTGYRQYTLEVKDLRTGRLWCSERKGEHAGSGQVRGTSTFRVQRVTSAAWAGDNRTLFYVTEDEVTKRSNQLWRHVSGSAAPDQLLYEEKDERFRMDVEKSRSGAYLFLVINSHTTSEIRYLRADRPDAMFQLVAEREEEHEYYLDHHPGSAADRAGGIFFIRTNSGGRTYRLMTAPTSDPRR